MTDDEVLFIRAKLATLEFFVEVMMAQDLGYGSKEAQDAMLAELVRLIRTKARVAMQPTEAQSAELLEVAMRATEYSARLTEKISDRADNIRDMLNR